MWSTAYRDAALVEALGAVMDGTWFPPVGPGVEILIAGRAVRGRRRGRVVATLRLAVDFPAWRTLSASGLADADAADVAAAFVVAAGPPGDPRPASSG